MKSAVAALLWSLVILAPRVSTGQTLDELQYPLLAKGKAAASADYVNFALQSQFVSIDSPTYTYFHPYYVLLPRIAVGIRDNLQLKVDATYQFPTLYSDPTFVNPGTYARDQQWIQSFLAELTFRPSPGIEVSASYLSGRSDYNLLYTRDPATIASHVETYNTDLVQIRGTWLPLAARTSDPIGADLNGLNHPLLRSHRSKIDWDLLWRRYGSASREIDNMSTDFLADDIRSVDTRIGFGAAYGVADRLQLGADGYWQPPFRIAQLTRSQNTFGAQTFTNVDDSSRRFHQVFGTRVNARWRPTSVAEAFAEMTWEHQALSNDTPSPPWTEAYRTLRVSTGATWLSRRPTTSVPLTADVTGLFHPLLEKKQLRIDAQMDYRGDRGDLFSGTTWLWRAKATIGLSSSLQAALYGGGLHAGTLKSSEFASLGSTLAFRIGKRVEMYASGSYHPAAFIDRYPTFILRRRDVFRYYHDFLNDDVEDDVNLHVGARFVF